MSEPQGPVHLDLPEDVALAPATEAVAPLLPPALRWRRHRRPTSRAPPS